MKPVGQPGADKRSIEFVPKRELDQAQKEIDRLRKENDRLQQETDVSPGLKHPQFPRF